jgi:hypothetical protein
MGKGKLVHKNLTKKLSLKIKIIKATKSSPQRLRKKLDLLICKAITEIIIKDPFKIKNMLQVI